MKRFMGLCLFSIGLMSCGPRTERLTHSRPVVSYWEYVDAEGRKVDDLSADSTALYKFYGTVLVPLKHPAGTEITWGDWRFAGGEAEFACRNGETQFNLKAWNLIPNAKYTVWVALHEPPGFREAGEGSVTGFSPVGPLDGSGSVFETNSAGQGTLEAPVLSGPVTFPVPDKPPAEVPGCLLEAYQSSIILQYKLDGEAHGHIPGEPSKVATHLMWLVTYGQAENAETMN